MKICLVTLESLDRQRPLSGGALRVYGLKYLLEGAGYNVCLLVPARAVPPESGVETFTLTGAQSDGLLICDLPQRVQELNPDLVIVEQWGLLDQLRGVSQPLYCDLHGSLLWENFYRNTMSSGDLKAKLMAFSRCSGFITCGQRQKYYFLAFAMMAGLNMAAHEVLTIPLFLPEPWYEPLRSHKWDSFVVSGGGSWAWIDQGNPEQVEGIFSQHGLEWRRFQVQPLIQELTAETFGNQMLKGTSHDKVLSYYSNALAAYDWYRMNRERELAITTRTIEYLYLGLPVIYQREMELSSWIETEGLGLVIQEPLELNKHQDLRSLLQRARERLTQGIQHLLGIEKTTEAFAGFLQTRPPERSCYISLGGLESANRSLVVANQELSDENDHLRRQVTRLESENRILREEQELLLELYVSDAN